MRKMYKPKNIGALAVNYTATAGLVTASFLLGGPIVLGATAVAMGGLSFFMIRSQKKFMENNLVRHPDIHQFSPRLGETAAELYKKSGLNAKDHPIYDFKPDSTKTKKKRKSLTEIVMEQSAKTHNAAAMRFGKPIIMISEPLLKLLDSNEEKAVLAHEFAHAVARHQHVSLPSKLLMGTAAVANSITRLTAFFSLGLPAIGASIGGGFVTRRATALSHKNRKLLFSRNKALSLSDVTKKKKLKSLSGKVGTLTTIGIAGYFSPAYLGLAAAVTALNAGAQVAGGLLSRSMEYQADKGAVQLGGDPLALVTALRKMELVQKRSLEEAFGGNIPKSGKLTKTWKKMTSTHPATARRIKKLSGIARKQGVSEDAIKKAVNDPIQVSADNNMSYETIRTMIAG
jgi:heat shock protein HtpX